MKIRMVKGVLLLVFLLSFGCALRGDWRKYRSAEGNFYILMLGKPTSQKIILDTDFGRTYLYSFMSDTKDDFTYSVSYVDYPAELFQKKTIEQILSNGRDGALKATRGKLTSESPILIKQYPGREIIFEVGDGKGIVQSRFFLVKQRLYELSVATLKENSWSRNIKKFLDSFELIE